MIQTFYDVVILAESGKDKNAYLFKSVRTKKTPKALATQFVKEFYDTICSIYHIGEMTVRVIDPCTDAPVYGVKTNINSFTSACMFKGWIEPRELPDPVPYTA